MKLFLLLLFSLASVTQAQFLMGRDDLCFLNKDPDLAQFGIWGEIGAREGVCQGMASISKIFFENVQFKPNSPKSSDNKQRLLQALRSYRIRPAQKIVITGYDGLYDLCSDYRNTFLQYSIELNRDIAIKDIAPLYPEFNWIQDQPIWNEAQRERLHEAVQRQLGHLARGTFPLILVYSHVMLVVDIQWVGSGYYYTYYDSNDVKFRNWFVPYGNGQLPLLGQRMIWDITLGN